MTLTAQLQALPLVQSESYSGTLRAMTVPTITRTARAADAGQQGAPAVPEEYIPATLQEAPSEQLELGGPEGPEPTRFGDWERKGRCIDF